MRAGLPPIGGRDVATCATLGPAGLAPDTPSGRFERIAPHAGFIRLGIAGTGLPTRL
ncbi:hypothetical protein KIF24_06575 [Micromonospora sp. Llam7]|uniref:hypothetical protein n=1 Tax=Micromonospora tarapacensis TaxID=2835305 RepID=UPI001C82C621|nr:hypothetical protein [Micromonospora tarapacensis]MBX7265728.1 hypothetical protein [Micromonospora tarapacensis]